MHLLIRVLKPFGYYDDHEAGEEFSIPLRSVNELVKLGLVEIVVNNIGNNVQYDEDENAEPFSVIEEVEPYRNEEIWGCRHCGDTYAGSSFKGNSLICPHCKNDQSKSYEENMRLLDAKIAVEKHGWVWENMHGIRNILVAPENDDRRYWTAIWDKNGIPHFLPKYSQE